MSHWMHGHTNAQCLRAWKGEDGCGNQDCVSKSRLLSSSALVHVCVNEIIRIQPPSVLVIHRGVLICKSCRTMHLTSLIHKPYTIAFC